MKTLHLTIDTMTCGSCVRRVERALMAADAVVTSIDKAGAVVVVGDDVDDAVIVGAVKAAGYDARVQVRS